MKILNGVCIWWYINAVFDKYPKKEIAWGKIWCQRRRLITPSARRPKQRWGRNPRALLLIAGHCTKEFNFFGITLAFYYYMLEWFSSYGYWTCLPCHWCGLWLHWKRQFLPWNRLPLFSTAFSHKTPFHFFWQFEHLHRLQLVRFKAQLLMQHFPHLRFWHAQFPRFIRWLRSIHLAHFFDLGRMNTTRIVAFA